MIYELLKRFDKVILIIQQKNIFSFPLKTPVSNELKQESFTLTHCSFE